MYKEFCDKCGKEFGQKEMHYEINLSHYVVANRHNNIAHPLYQNKRIVLCESCRGDLERVINNW